MKAVTYGEYGSPDVLTIEDVDVPAPKPDEALVRILGAAVNPGDWDLLHGTPYVLRLQSGLRQPRKRTLGFAVAGRGEQGGDHVNGPARGDRVYAGISGGGFAEYACIGEKALARMPSNLTFEQAAAVPISGVTALQAMRDVGQVQPGQRVLINGASGGVGTFAVQIAKALGANVTGVCGPSHVAMVRSLGADEVIDYTRDDFTANGQQYDLLLDNVGNRSLSECRRALRPTGTLIPNSNKDGGRWLGRYLGRALQALAISPFVPQRLRPFAATDKREDLMAMTALIESGSVTPVIDSDHPLTETSQALARYGLGHAGGKIVIRVSGDEIDKEDG